jgi:hypothetical protein
VNSATSKQRIAGWCIALLIEALIILAMLSLGGQFGTPPQFDSGLKTFEIGPTAETAMPSRKEENPTARERDNAAAPPETARPVRPAPEVAPITPPSPSQGFVELSREDLDAGDISKLGAKSGSSTSSASGDAVALVGPGEGPGGKPLYNAEWVREPTNSELAPYFSEAKPIPPGAWAMVACLTIADNRVENCQTLGESPPGSGLSKALRRASWQFLVRPPRIGNKPQLGVWVRIRFDFTKAVTEGG